MPKLKRSHSETKKSKEPEKCKKKPSAKIKAEPKNLAVVPLYYKACIYKEPKSGQSVLNVFESREFKTMQEAIEKLEEWRKDKQINVVWGWIGTDSISFISRGMK